MNLIYHPIFLKHLVDENCPERPDRLSQILEKLNLEKGLLPEYDSRFFMAGEGSKELYRFHDHIYFKRLKELCSSLGEGEVTKVIDNCFSQDTFNAAAYAVGAALKAADLAILGEKSFALVRPPGHHAIETNELGFCYFNNIAIAADYLLENNEKVFILDIDLHFGNGTQDYVESMTHKIDSLFYFSTNHDNIWPHIKPEDNNNTQHIFLPNNIGDSDYISVLEEKLVPAINKFEPSIIAVSAGFDTSSIDNRNYEEILGGGFNLTERSYLKVKEILDNALIPYFAILEGGYDPESVLIGVNSFLGDNWVDKIK